MQGGQIDRIDGRIDAAAGQHGFTPAQDLSTKLERQRRFGTDIELAVNISIAEYRVGKARFGSKCLVAQGRVGLKTVGVIAIATIALLKFPVSPGFGTDKGAKITPVNIQIQSAFQHRGDRLAFIKIQVTRAGVASQFAGCQAQRVGNDKGIRIRIRAFCPDLRAHGHHAMNRGLKLVLGR